MTNTPPVPEVVAVSERLATIPDAWRTPAFDAAVVHRAKMTAARRLLQQTLSGAQQDRNDCAARLAGGDLSAVDALQASSAAVLAAEFAATAAPTADLPAGVADDPVQMSRQALAVAGSVLTIVDHDFQTERSAWDVHTSRLGFATEPPTATDLDRAVAAQIGPVRAEVETWRSGVRGLEVGGADIVDRLAAAASYVDAASALASRVDDLNAVITEANAARAAAGLTWTPSNQRIGARV